MVDVLAEGEAGAAGAEGLGGVGVAEGDGDDDAVALGEAEGGDGAGLVVHRYGAGGDAVGPGGDHDVLGGAAGVEVAAGLGEAEGDGGGGGGEVLGEVAAGGEFGEALAVAEDDEAAGLGVLGAAGHATGLEDAMEDVVGQGLVEVGAGVALGDDGFVGVHGTSASVRSQIV